MYRTHNHGGASAFLGWTIATLCVAFLALVLGAFAALFPASTVTKFSIVMFGGVVLAAALLVGSLDSDRLQGKAVRIATYVWLFTLGSIPSYLPFKYGIAPGLNPSRLATWALLAIWLFHVVASGRVRGLLIERIKSSPFAFLAVVAFVTWQIVAAFLSEQPVFSLYVVLKGVVPAFLIFLIFLSSVESWRQSETAIVSLLLGALFSCLVGAIEWRTQVNPFTRFFPVDPDQLEGLAWILADKSRGGAYRVSATFTHPLALAEFLCMCLPLAGLVAIRGSTKLIRRFGQFMVPALMFTIYLSHTRSSLIGAALVVGLFTFNASLLMVKDRARPAAAMGGWMLLAILAISVVAASGIFSTLAEGRNPAERGSSQARVIMFERGVDAIQERPIQGYGPGRAAQVIGFLPNARSLTIDSHYLGLAIDGGVTSLILFAIAATLVLANVWRKGALENRDYQWVLPTIGIAIVASLAIKSVLSLDNNSPLLFGLMGLVLASAESARRTRSPSGR